MDWQTVGAVLQPHDDSIGAIPRVGMVGAGSLDLVSHLGAAEAHRPTPTG